jgi:DNA-binding MarR family transcriptional regulator
MSRAIAAAMQGDTGGNPAFAYASICTNAALRRAARRIGQFYDDALAPAALRGTQYSLLVQVDRLGRPTMRQLADELVMDLSALGHTLKPLVRDGFVDLVPDELDRRSRRVGLTEQGAAKLKQARALWKKMQKRFDGAFGKTDATQLHATLDLIASAGFARRLGAASPSRAGSAHPRTGA